MGTGLGKGTIPTSWETSGPSLPLFSLCSVVRRNGGSEGLFGLTAWESHCLKNSQTRKGPQARAFPPDTAE
jgi:hypothetical protein